MTLAVPCRSIQAAAAAWAGLRTQDLRGPSRRQPVARARQLAMWLARELTELSTTQIGHAFGRRDHTTVLHALRAVEARRAEDPSFAGETDALRQRLAEVMQMRAGSRAWDAALRQAARRAIAELGEDVIERLKLAADRDPLGVLAALGQVSEAVTAAGGGSGEGSGEGPGEGPGN